MWPRSACLASSSWGMRHAGLVTTRHGGVTGSGHERHCARYWYCMERLCLCKAYTEAQGRGTRPVSDVRFSPISSIFGEVGSGASAPPLRRRIRFNRPYSLYALSLSTARRLTCLNLATPPCHGAHQNSIPRLRLYEESWQKPTSRRSTAAADLCQPPTSSI